MKKILLIFVAVMMAGALMFFIGAGEKEQETMVLKFVHNPAAITEIDGKETTYWIWAGEQFGAANPGVEIRQVVADIVSGSTITMDVLNAAGEPADIYTDYIGRVGKYMHPAWALPLDDYIDLDVFVDGVLEPLKREGLVYGVPLTTNILGMIVNLDMLAELGIEPPGLDWTIDDFLKIAVRIRDTSDYYAAGLFTGNQSCDYLYMNWFASFGTVMYNDDYTKSTVNTPAGIQTFKFLQYINESGFVSKGAEVFVDDDHLALWKDGKIAFSGGFNSWPTAFGVKFENYKAIPFPRAPGVEKVPGCANYNGVVVHKSDDEERNKMAAKFAAYISGPIVQKIILQSSGGFSTVKDMTITSTSQEYEGLQYIFENNGMWDQGIALPVFVEIRKQMFPILAKLYTGKITPEDAAVLFDKNVDAILNQ